MSMATDFVTALAADGDVSASFSTIKHAWSTEPLDDLKADTPAVLVFPGPDTVRPTELDGFVAQYVAKHLHCFVVAKHANIDARKDEVRAVALGWQFNASHDEMELLSGEPVSLKGDYIWWLDIFITRTQIRQT